MRRIALLWALLAGCQHRPPPPAARNVLRVQMEAEPPSLNPLIEHDAWTNWICLDAVYEPLVREDPTSGKILPALAASFDAPDDKTLHFVLRDDVTWHDGKPFSGADVAATFDRLRDPGASSVARSDFVDLVKIDTSPTEVTLRFSKPTPLALQSLAHLVILPAHLFPSGDLKAQPASRAPVGTGAYRFVEWKPGASITLTRNERYWGPRPPLDGIELDIVRDGEAAFELFRRGQLDLIWRLSSSQRERADREKLRVAEWRLPTYSLVVWNLRRPGLGDRRVRQALALLTDRARYLQVAFSGHALPVTGPYPLDSPSYDRTVAGYPFDPARARKLLDEAGILDRDGDGVRELDGKPFTIAFLLTAGSKSLEPLVTMMQEDFAKSGVKLEVAPTEWGTLLDRLRKHSFDAAGLQWSMQPVQDNYSLFHSSQAERGQNYGGLRDPTVDALLEEIRRTPIGPARVELDHRLHKLISDEQPYLFLGSPEVDSLLSPKVANFHPSQDGLGFRTLSLDGGGGK
jgi:peptide/nickel transport system substrate-binding protein